MSHVGSPPLPAWAIKSPRLFGVSDVLLCLLAGVAVFATTESGSAIALIAAISIIGLPFAAFIWFAFPILCFLAPLRIGYRVVRPFAGRVTAFLGAVLIALASFAAIDTYLRGDTVDDAITGFINRDTALVAVTQTDTIGLRNEWGRETLDCHPICRDLLTQGRVSEVVMFSKVSDRSVGYRSRVGGSACADVFPAGREVWVDSDDLCAAFVPQPPTVVYRLENVPAAEWPDSPQVENVYRVTVRNGGLSQSVHLVDARFAVGGGLLHPSSAGTMGERLMFTPRTRSHSFTNVPDDPMLAQRYTASTFFANVISATLP